MKAFVVLRFVWTVDLPLPCPHIALQQVENDKAIIQHLRQTDTIHRLSKRMRGARVFQTGNHVMQNFRNFQQQRRTLSFASRHAQFSRSRAASLKSHTVRALDVGRYNSEQCATHTPSRQMSWVSRLFSRRRSGEPFSHISDGQDEAARAAILAQLMKGRQPSDLMLRCTLGFIFCA